MVNIWVGIMLICFGASWPSAIIKTIRVKNPAGKSFLFMTLIILGYIAGIIGHLSANGKSSFTNWVFWLYIVDVLMVATDYTLSLYYHNMRKKQASQDAE